MKFFISCINQTTQLGAMQIECDETEVKAKSEKMCPERATFKAYGIPEWDDNMPIGEFVPMEKMKELGY